MASVLEVQERGERSTALRDEVGQKLGLPGLQVELRLFTRELALANRARQQEPAVLDVLGDVALLQRKQRPIRLLRGFQSGFALRADERVLRLDHLGLFARRAFAERRFVNRVFRQHDPAGVFALIRDALDPDFLVLVEEQLRLIRPPLSRGEAVEHAGRALRQQLLHGRPVDVASRLVLPDAERAVVDHRLGLFSLLLLALALPHLQRLAHLVEARRLFAAIEPRALVDGFGAQRAGPERSFVWEKILELEVARTLDDIDRVLANLAHELLGIAHGPLHFVEVVLHVAGQRR